MNRLEEARRHVKSARAINDKYQGKDMPVSAAREMRDHLNEADVLRAEAAEPVYKHSMTGGDYLGSVSGDGQYEHGGVAACEGKSVARASDWPKLAAKSLQEMASKAVVSGSIDVPAILADSVSLPEGDRRLLQLIPEKVVSENSFAYLQQTVRTNNAAAVADNAQKPESVFTFKEVDDRARVIAHLSEPIPQRYLQDYDELYALLRGEMSYGVQAAIESQCTSGDGTGENFTGITEVSGTTSVDFDTDMATTLRAARAALAAKDETPTAYVLNPADAISVEGDADASLDIAQRVYGGLRVVTSTAVDQGTALLADWSLTRLYIRERARLDVDAGGDLFEKNQVRLRAEQRCSFALLRPQSMGVITLTE